MFDDRLKNLRKAKGVTQADAADALGIKESAYSNYEKDLREPNAVVLKAMSKYFGVTIDYLLDCHTGFVASRAEQEHIKKYRSLDQYGQKAVSSMLDIEYERCTYTPEPNRDELIEVSINYAPVSAGFGDELEDYEQWEKASVPLTPESRKADFILVVDGDSMEPKFHNGDYILVRKQPAVDIGQIGIFGVDGKGYIKKYGGDKLISLNKKYSDIPLDEESRCFGLVLGVTDISE